MVAYEEAERVLGLVSEPEVAAATSRESTARDKYWYADRFQPPLLGRAAEARVRLRLGPDGHLWRYSHGVYLPDGSEWLAEFVRGELGDEFRRHRLGEVEAWCKAKHSDRISIDPSPDCVNVRNGLLYPFGDSPELEPHDPEVVSLAQIDAAWEPEADCPNILRFLIQSFPDQTNEVVAFLMEWVGYCLVPSQRLKKALMLCGPSNTGKSVLLAVIERLLGSVNVSNKTLQTISDNRFAAAGLYGKLANICADLDAKTLKQTGMFKAITGGVDSIDAERKYGDSFSFVPYSRLMFSANNPPGTPDQTTAYYGRWLLLPMAQVRTQADQDPGLIDRLTTDAEMSGLLRHGVNGMRRLMDRGHFDEPPLMTKAGTDYRAKTDTVVGYVEDRCEFDPDARTRTSALYSDYKTWCEEVGKHHLSEGNFRAQLDDTYELADLHPKSAGYPTWFGIRPAYRDP